jgi:hypothetical protein
MRMLEAGDSKLSTTEGLCQAVGKLAEVVETKTSGANHRAMDLKRQFFRRKIISGGKLAVVRIGGSIRAPLSP